MYKLSIAIAKQESLNLVICNRVFLITCLLWLAPDPVRTTLNSCDIVKQIESIEKRIFFTRLQVISKWQKCIICFVLNNQLFLLQNLHPRKLGLLFIPWSFFLLRLFCISINLPYPHACNTVVSSGLVPLVATWNCLISYKNWYAELSALYMLLLLNS